jgi:hypothetical protein
VIASANASTALSSSVNASLVRQSLISTICRSVSPAFLPTAEPISIHQGQPIRVAARRSASIFTLSGNDRARSCASSIIVVPNRTALLEAVIATGSGTLPSLRVAAQRISLPNQFMFPGAPSRAMGVGYQTLGKPG